LLIERNYIYQCFDGAISPQSSPSTTRSNLTIRNNILHMNQVGIGVLENGTTFNGLYIYNNTSYFTQSWSSTPTVQRPNGNTQRQSMNFSYGSATTVSNQDIRNNTFAGSSAPGNNDAFGLSQTTCSWGSPQSTTAVLTCTLTGATWNYFDYNNWSAANGNPTTYIGYGNPSLATWFSNHGFETHSAGVMNVDPSFTNQSQAKFAPTIGSPLRNAGINLFAQGVVWDFFKTPRPPTGNFTIGAIQ
jgi:hypothetical protein